jgi:predicted metal-binding membrane protein
MSTIGSEQPSALERVIRRDRAAGVLALGAITLLAWVYLLRAGAEMQAMASQAEMHAAMGMTMVDMHLWGVGDWATLFVMWAVMMVGMMLPSAAQVILLVLGAYRRRGDRRARVSGAAFVTGYVVVWTTFSAVAAAAQVLLHRAALLNADMTNRSPLLAGSILLAAGIYQWLPIKNLCLSKCQSPIGFIATHWREGTAGALRMGIEHGGFCVGCCWALMALLFVIGVMNLVWVAIIACLVLVEKLFPRGALVGRAAGVLLIVWAVFEFTRVRGGLI